MLHFVVTSPCEGLNAAALYDDSRLCQLCVYRTDEDLPSGTVVLGLVEKVLPDLGAAYVRLGKKQGYLETKKRDLHTGESIPVQVKRPAKDGKKALVSDTVTFPGLSKQEADALLAQVEEKAKTRTLYSILYTPEIPWISFLKDLPEGRPDRTVTDLPQVYEKLKTFDRLPEVIFYTDDSYPLSSAFNLRRDMERLLEKKVFLGSGAYLVIEKTEACYTIDVNSGKSIYGKDREEAYLRIDREAVAEAARQIRLRNLSGMILIDLINLEEKSAMEEVTALLKEELKKDAMCPRFHDLTALGIAEVTRARKSPSLKELTSSF